MIVTQSNTLKAQVEVAGATAQLMEYRWSRGSTIIVKPDRSVVLRRAQPSALRALVTCGSKLRMMGHLSFAPADVTIPVHVAREDGSALLVKCCYDKNWLSTVAAMPDHWDQEDIARCLDVRSGRIDQAMKWLGAELVTPGLSSALMVESITRLVAIELSRYFSQKSGGFKVRTADGKLMPSDLRRITEYIESGPDACPTLDDLSRLCGISSTHLRRSFKNTTGKTLHQYVDEIRLQKAKMMLSETDLALKEVAYRLGFSVPNAFAYAFRKAQGETPSGYRRRVRH